MGSVRQDSKISKRRSRNKNGLIKYTPSSRTQYQYDLTWSWPLVLTSHINFTLRRWLKSTRDDKFDIYVKVSQGAAKFTAPVAYHREYLAYMVGNSDSFTWVKNLVTMTTIYGSRLVSYYELKRTSNGTTN